MSRLLAGWHCLLVYWVRREIFFGVRRADGLRYLLWLRAIESSHRHIFDGARFPNHKIFFWEDEYF